MRPVALALALLAVQAATVRAEDDRRWLPDPRSLPETLRGTVLVPVAEAGPATRLTTLREVSPALAACWRVPEGLSKIERGEVTLRFSLRRDGTVQGTPRVTFANLSVDGAARQVLTDAALDAIRRCTPLNLDPGLGAAVAGRPFAIRFIYDGPKGRGA
jgi:hypothetical protein